MLYVMKTNRGYLKGDIYRGVEFKENKDDARKFTLTEAQLYRDSIIADMFEFFDCKKCGFEEYK